MTNFRRDATRDQKAMNRRIHKLYYEKSLANLNGNVKLANQIELKIRELRRKMGEIAFGKA